MKVFAYLRFARKEQCDESEKLRSFGEKIMREIKSECVNPMMRYSRLLQMASNKR